MFVLAKRRSKQLFTVPWRARGTVAFGADRNVGTVVCPALRPTVRCALRRPDPPVVCPGFGLDRFTKPKSRRSTGQQRGTKSASRPAYKPRINRLSTADFVPAFPDMPCMQRVYLSNPKPGHTTGGSGRSAWRSGRAGSGKIGCQQNYSPKKQKSTVPSKASKKRRFNVSPEAPTSEILCKPTEEQNQRLTTGLSAVYYRDEKRAFFLAAEQWNDAFLSW